jgi:tRNA pseudouridine38-40 synthase
MKETSDAVIKNNYRMLISYDGTDYCGWQKQGEHAFGPDKPSLQETLEIALQKILNEPIDLCASGRTDAGVHAIAQQANFFCERPLPKDLCWALKAKLPASIAAKKVWLAPQEFHSTLSARAKTYRYWVWNDQRATALLARYSWWVRNPLDIEKLNHMSQFLLGRQDFASFRSMGTPVKHTIREIYRAQWTWKNRNLLQFEITGNGFMKQMVRNIVGTLVEADLKGQESSRIREILAKKDRKAAGATAPPQGLFLKKVYYPKDLDNRCRQL